MPRILTSLWLTLLVAAALAVAACGDDDDNAATKTPTGGSATATADAGGPQTFEVTIKDEGKTVFLSSHQLADVELICSRVAIIHKGKLLRTGTVHELVAGERTEIIVQGKATMNGMLEKLKAPPSVLICGPAR